MNPENFLNWINVAAALVHMGKVTYEEIAEIFHKENPTTTEEARQANNEALAQLRVIIATQRRKAAIEAGLQRDPY